MNRRRTFTLMAAAVLGLCVTLLSGDVSAQQKITKDQLVGTWAYVSVVVQHADGTRIETFGPNPKGSLIFTADGRYSLVLLRPDLVLKESS